MIMCRLCAIAERGERPSMHIFDLRTFRRKKTIVTADLMTKVSLSYFPAHASVVMSKQFILDAC